MQPDDISTGTPISHKSFTIFRLDLSQIPLLSRKYILRTFKSILICILNLKEMDQEFTPTRPYRITIRRRNSITPQPTPTDLAKLGIKVRDFAYESTLPPVRSVYLQPQQIQPSIPKRVCREDTEPMDEFLPKISQSQANGQALVRTITEPNFSCPLNTRELGGCFEITDLTSHVVSFCSRLPSSHLDTRVKPI
jgi:hypothetical protein